MVEVIEKGEKQTANIILTITKQEKKDQIIKHGIWCGDKRDRDDNFIQISPDTLYST